MSSFVLEVDFFNTFLLRRNVDVSLDGNTQGIGPIATTSTSSGGGSASAPIGQFPGPGPAYPGAFNFTNDNDKIKYNWYVEESRIRGGFNNTSTDIGVRAYLDEPFPLQQNRVATLIYSGPYNSRTGINRTNVFSVGEDITKSLDPAHGSIQKTHAEETNLVVFQENRIHRALIDKDTIYTTESGTQTQAGRAVIGQFVQYKGEYGISKNPESFAIYNYRKYFTDKNRNAVMRLSNDGLTEISSYGMRDYFRDELFKVKSSKTTRTFQARSSLGASQGDMSVSVITSAIDAGNNITPGMIISGNTGGYVTHVYTSGNNTVVLYSTPLNVITPQTDVVFIYYTKGKLKGGWDVYGKNYTLSLQESPIQVERTSGYKTLCFDEEINGWVSFFDYKPSQMFSILNNYYTIGASNTTNSTKLYKHYSTTPNTHANFYGEQFDSNVTFVLNPQPDVMKNFQTISYEGSNGWEVESYVSGFTGKDPNPDTVTGGYVQSNDSIVSIKSYDEGSYVDANTGYTLRAGFDRKENRYVANLINNSAAATGEILFGAQMSGIKGYFATVTIKTDGTTNVGGSKELWAAGSNYVVSSY